MKTLLVVLTHPAAEPILRMNWPWLKRSGADEVMVIHHADKPPSWHPSDAVRGPILIGTDPDKQPNLWVGRLLETMEFVCGEARTTGEVFDRYIFCESDTIFVRPPLGGTGATTAGGWSPGFLGSKYFHCPWQFTPGELAAFVDRAGRLLRKGLIEQGFIDRFLGLYEDLYGPIIAHHPNFTMNTITPEHYQEANAALKGAAWAAHGVKSKEALDAITKGL